MIDTTPTRLLIEREGVAGFRVASLAETDLDDMQWAGDALHLDIMRAQIRDTNQFAHTLGVYAPSGLAVSKGYVVHDLAAGESTLSQFATHPKLQSLGLGRLLIAGIEARVREQGIARAVLGVETTNPRARALYESVGYQWFRSAKDSWQATKANGSTYTHETMVDWLAKSLWRSTKYNHPPRRAP